MLACLYPHHVPCAFDRRWSFPAAYHRVCVDVFPRNHAVAAARVNLVLAAAADDGVVACWIKSRAGGRRKKKKAFGDDEPIEKWTDGCGPCFFSFLLETTLAYLLRRRADRHQAHLRDDLLSLLSHRQSKTATHATSCLPTDRPTDRPTDLSIYLSIYAYERRKKTSSSTLSIA